MRLQIQSQPASEPITTAEAKTHCRITISSDDTYIDSLITAARRYIENRTGRQIVTATWDGYLDAFPDGVIELPRFPLASVTHVKYYDTGGTLQTLSSDAYDVDTASLPGVVALAPGNDWPATQTDKRNAVTVQFVAGQAVNAVPAEVKHLIKFVVAHFYELREPADSLRFEKLPYSVEAMIWNLKPDAIR